ncbi:hypothetical protein CN955_19525 [Priestia megaterium]|nr:hypothetical protein CN955_19525 [Priestia megaterium]
MKKFVLKFLNYFLVFFVGNFIVNILLKSQADLLTAFSTVIGVSLGLAVIGFYINKKSKAA